MKALAFVKLKMIDYPCDNCKTFTFLEIETTLIRILMLVGFYASLTLRQTDILKTMQQLYDDNMQNYFASIYLWQTEDKILSKG